jgi:hypothetical protein
LKVESLKSQKQNQWKIDHLEEISADVIREDHQEEILTEAALEETVIKA